MDSLKVKDKIANVSNFICFNTSLRIINQVIFREYLSPLLEIKSNKDWEIRVCDKLKLEYGIDLLPRTIKKYLTDLKKGRRNAIAASDFTSKIPEKSIPLSRYEKDSIYARLDLLIHLYLQEEINYIGLPANQLLAFSHKYHNIVACERDYKMAQFMYKMKSELITNKNVEVVQSDIIDYLEKTDKKFNLFDFDLMCALNPLILSRLINCIARTSMDTSVISIVSIGGRKITTKEYERLMPYLFIFKLKKKGFQFINKPFSGRYKDHRFPMRYELFVIKRMEESK